MRKLAFLFLPLVFTFGCDQSAPTARMQCHRHLPFPRERARTSHLRMALTGRGSFRLCRLAMGAIWCSSAHQSL